MTSYESDTFNALLSAQTDICSSMYFMNDPQKVERPDIINNQMEVFFEYVPGIRHGLYRRYNLLGQLLYACNYEYGRRHGQSIEYYPNGKIRIKCKFNIGTVDGPVYLYDINGIHTHTLNYKNGLCIY